MRVDSLTEEHGKVSSFLHLVRSSGMSYEDEERKMTSRPSVVLGGS